MHDMVRDSRWLAAGFAVSPPLSHARVLLSWPRTTRVTSGSLGSVTISPDHADNRRHRICASFGAVGVDAHY